MTDCILQQTDSGRWWCPKCDPKGKRLLQVKAHRNCPKTTPRESLIDEAWQLAETHATGTTQHQMNERLDDCESCEQFTGRACGRYGGCDGRRRWLQMLATNNGGCEKWGMSKFSTAANSG